MSNFVIGFDIGTSSSYVVIGENNGIESIANEYSDRNTPTYVSFTDKMRFIGQEAKQQQITNIPNTINNFTKLLGKTFNDSIVQKEMTEVGYKVIAILNNRVGIEVSYLNETRIFTPEQVYAMQLTKLKEVAEAHLLKEVKDVVINVPTFSTESERQAIFEATQIANLNCLGLIEDTTASALAYGIYHDNLSREKTVVFIDIGYSNLQSSVVKFRNGMMTVIATSCEQVGGRDFDNVIYKKIKKDILKIYKLKINDVTKPGIRLKQECEKLKKMMSANSIEIPLNIDCFMDDVDITCKMCRSEFEELSNEILNRIKNTLKFLLRKAKLTAKDIQAVEIIGGSSRIPAIKQIISDIFQKEIRTSLNADESVARGCALQCTVFKHANKVNNYRIMDNSCVNTKSAHSIIYYPADKICQFAEMEKQIQLQVEMEKEKMNVKNSVEEYIYDKREKVENEVVDEEQKRLILSELSNTENWLYEDGENVSKQEYLDKLEILKKLTENIF